MISSLIFLLIFLFVRVAWLILFVFAARFIYSWISAYYGNDQQKGPSGRLDRGRRRRKHKPPRTNQGFSSADMEFLRSIGILVD